MQDIFENIKTYFADISFADPWYLLALALIPIYAWRNHYSQKKKFVQMKASDLSGIKQISNTGKVKYRSSLFVLRCLAVASAVIALARPQTGFSNEKISTRGIDILISLDVSPSMYAVDLRPNRLEAAKVTAKEFIDARKNDRIGLVVFAAEAFTQCPITLDHNLLKSQIDFVDNWQLGGGTALGDGLFMAVNRIADTTQLNTKVIILLTDGYKNAGEFSPLDAAAAAQQLNVRVYTIGVGKKSGEPIPIFDKNGREAGYLDPSEAFDEPTMQEIANITGGKYFRASSKEGLSEIYKEIDAIEKQKVDVSITKRYDEKFYPFAFAAIIFLLLEIILSQTIFRSIT
ncbi:MAG: vWA domain-containing protein [Chitinophagales bacterium]